MQFFAHGFSGSDTRKLVDLRWIFNLTHGSPLGLRNKAATSSPLTNTLNPSPSPTPPDGACRIGVSTSLSRTHGPTSLPRYTASGLLVPLQHTTTSTSLPSALTSRRPQQLARGSTAPPGPHQQPTWHLGRYPPPTNGHSARPTGAATQRT